MKSITGKHLLSLCFLLVGLTNTKPAAAQLIAPANDGMGTAVNVNGNQIDISGGTFSNNGANLFHSFQQFGLSQGEIANFLSNPQVENILGRVTGGNASIINGLIQVTGGNSNLYLLNPAGIIFGSNASLNVPASFTATTANGIQMGDQWFGMNTNPNITQSLGGIPNGFAFSTAEPGSIINAGNLAVPQGESLTLVGGTVVNTGTLSASGGEVTISAVPGESLVRISQPGSLLSLDLPLATKETLNGNTQPLTPATLPLLLAGGNLGNATGIAVENGVVKLTGSGIAIDNGDVATTGKVTAQTATLSAEHNLTVANSQLETTGNLNLLAKDTVRVRDSATTPVVLKAGGNLTLEGEQKVDIFALNHASSGLHSAEDMTLRSASTVSGDAHYFTGGNFRIEQLNGSLGDLDSPGDPVIRASGNVSFANYTGQSLHILAGGSVNVSGNITITDKAVGTAGTDYLVDNFNLSDGTPIAINGNTRPTLDIRAGVASPPGVDSCTGAGCPGGITNSGAPLSAEINIGGSIRVTADDGMVLLSNQYQKNTNLADANITVTNGIDTSRDTGNGGSIYIDSRQDILLPSTGAFAIDASSHVLSGNGGTITLLAGRDLNATGDIYSTSSIVVSSGSTVSGNGGNITFKAGQDIQVGYINSQSAARVTWTTNTGTAGGSGNATAGVSGKVSMTAGRDITITDDMFVGSYAVSEVISTGTSTADVSSGDATGGIGGAITLNAGRNLSTQTLYSNSVAFSMVRAQSSTGTTGTVQSGTAQSTTGGAITLSAGNDIRTNFIQSGSRAETFALSGAPSSSTSSSVTGGNSIAGNGGAITITSTQGKITTNGVMSRSFSAVTTTQSSPTTGTITRGTSVAGNGGDIILESNTALTANSGEINLGNLPNNLVDSSSSGDSTGTGGAIRITANNSDLAVRGLNSSSSGTSGTRQGGAISLESTGTVTLFNKISAEGAGGGGNISVTGQEIDFTGGANSVRSTGNLALQPKIPGQNIVINGSADSGSETLDITTSDLNVINQGKFSSITLGRGDGTGTITLNPTQFNAPVHIAGGSTIVGANQNTTWNITGSDTGSISGFNSPVTFTSIENLVGGSADDTFAFIGNGNISGTINGNTGADHFDYSAYNSAVQLSVVDIIAMNIEQVTGSAYNDTIIGPNTTNTWEITGANAGKINNALSFSSVENLTGGNVSDTFKFKDGGSVSGNIDGVNVTDTLDYSAYSSPVTVNFATSKATAVGGNISSIEYLIGGTSDNDTVIGPNTVNSWKIISANTGNVGNVGFTDIENITGGTASDRFIFSDGATIKGILDGSDGYDYLDYTAYTTPVVVDLPNHIATGTAGAYNIEYEIVPPTPSIPSTPSTPPISNPTTPTTPPTPTVPTYDNNPPVNPPTNQPPVVDDSPVLPTPQQDTPPQLQVSCVVPPVFLQLNEEAETEIELAIDLFISAESSIAIEPTQDALKDRDCKPITDPKNEQISNHSLSTSTSVDQTPKQDSQF